VRGGPRPGRVGFVDEHAAIAVAAVDYVCAAAAQSLKGGPYDVR